MEILQEEIFQSYKFKQGLKKFLLKYSALEHYSNIKNFIRNDLKITFVKDGPFEGMCGYNGEIYLNLNHICFEVLKEKIENISTSKINEAKAFIIGTVIHELADSILREILLKNPLLSSPIGKGENEKIEVGYDLEEIIFGVVLMVYHGLESLVDLKNWKSDGDELISKREKKKQRLLGRDLNKKISGISCLHNGFLFK